MITIGEVSGIRRDDLPTDDETIADNFNIGDMAKYVIRINIYHRSKEDCPFNRGNLMIDLHVINGGIMAIKFPYAMTIEQANKWVAPLETLLQKKKH